MQIIKKTTLVEDIRYRGIFHIEEEFILSSSEIPEFSGNKIHVQSKKLDWANETLRVLLDAEGASLFSSIYEGIGGW